MVRHWSGSESLIVCLSLISLSVVSGNENDWMKWLMFGIGVESIVWLASVTRAKVSEGRFRQAR